MNQEQLAILTAMPRADRIVKYLPLLIGGQVTHAQYEFILHLPYTPSHVAAPQDSSKDSAIQNEPGSVEAHDDGGQDSGEVEGSGDSPDGRVPEITQEIAKNLGSG